MDWQIALLVIIGGLLFTMALGMPVAFCFMLISVIGAFLLSGQAGLNGLIRTFFDSVKTFSLLPVPLFTLMGEVMFLSGVAPKMMEALDKWLGRLPGRLGLLAVAGGTLFATLSGSSVASAAMLSATLVPEMEKRRYSKLMAYGPILGSGGLATLIPPSAIGVILAAVGEISVGKYLIAIIMPGILMAALFFAYILIACSIKPSLAPPYEVRHTPLAEKMMGTLLYILPIGFIVFLVTGVIFLGLATPTEAAGAGALGTFVLAACYGRLNWNVVKKATLSTFEITAMLFLILVGAQAYGQLLAFSGASKGLVQFASGLGLSPAMIVIAGLLIALFLGMFMASSPIIMITIPLFMPMIKASGLDPIWFGALFLIAIEVGFISPPFGLVAFVVKGAAGPDTTMADVFKAGIPFMGIEILTIAIVFALPAVALWLPSLMTG